MVMWLVIVIVLVINGNKNGGVIATMRTLAFKSSGLWAWLCLQFKGLGCKVPEDHQFEDFKPYLEGQGDALIPTWRVRGG